MFEEVSKKTFNNVLIEAAVVGALLIAVVYFIDMYLGEYIPDFSGNKKMVEYVFVAGALFHIVCEYSGLNLWYAKEYCKLL